LTVAGGGASSTLTPLRDAPPSRIEILTIYRGIAAVLVVLFHYPRFVALPSWTPLLPSGQTNSVFYFGHSGVDFFFVLSGFVMVWGYRQEAGDARWLWPYLKARFARIYPAYWAAVVAAVLYLWNHPGENDAALAPDALLRAALLYGRGPWVVPPSYTLPYELVCYLGFAAFFLVRPAIFSVAALAWCAAALCQWYGWLDVGSIWLAPRVLEWFLGAGGALLVLQVRPRGSALWLWTTGALVLVMALVDDVGAVLGHVHDVRNFAVAYLLVIIAGASYEITRRRRYPWLLMLLGEASYSIYLTHYYVIRAVSYSAARHPLVADALGPSTRHVVTLLVVVALGVAFWAVVERPLLAFTRRFTGVSPRVRDAS